MRVRNEGEKIAVTSEVDNQEKGFLSPLLL